ncbi:11493_t:CDS:1, partial [Acaulospora colombiana]
PVEFSKVARIIVPRSEPSTSKPQNQDLLVGPRQPFLEDRQTLAQLYGFLLGKCRRAQELHLFTFSHIISSSPASTVISMQEKIIAADYWTEDFPLGSFCAIIPAHTYIPYLESIQNEPQSLNQPLKSLDSRLQAALKVKHAKTRVRLLELLTILVGLKLEGLEGYRE